MVNEMKFKNWTPDDLKRWASNLPGSPLMNPSNKIKIWGEIHVDNSEEKEGSCDKNEKNK